MSDLRERLRRLREQQASASASASGLKGEAQLSEAAAAVLPPSIEAAGLEDLDPLHVRLRSLRPSGDTATNAEVSSAPHAAEAEQIDALLRAMQIDVGRDLPPLSPAKSDDGNSDTEAAEAITQAATLTKEDEAGLYTLLSEAAALKGSSSHGVKSPPSQSGLLVLEPKERPQLSRQATEDGQRDLQHDLADAMRDVLGGAGDLPDDAAEHPRETSSPVFDNAAPTAPSGTADSNDIDEGKEAEALLARLLQLRQRDASVPDHDLAAAHVSRTSTSPVPRSPSSALNVLSLPSVPSALPISADTDDHKGDIRARNKIDEQTDLRPYSALVRLNASKLAEPGSTSAEQARLAALSSLSARKTPSDDQDPEDDPDNWCCICNADASVKCVGCDADPYCSSCWAEGHERMGREELREHRTTNMGGGSRRRKKGGEGDPGRRRMMVA